VVEGPRVRLPDHLPALTAEEEKALESMLQAVSGGGLEPPMLSDLEAHVGGDAGLLHDLLDLLVDDGRLVSVSPDLYVTIDAEMRLREKAASVLARVEPAQASDFKEALGVSRRYLIPYLQHLDARQVTRRTPAGRVSGAACQSR
jgi:selenocysteine-specific elongation factor